MSDEGTDSQMTPSPQGTCPLGSRWNASHSHIDEDFNPTEIQFLAE